MPFESMKQKHAVVGAYRQDIERLKRGKRLSIDHLVRARNLCHMTAYISSELSTFYIRASQLDESYRQLELSMQMLREMEAFQKEIDKRVERANKKRKRNVGHAAASEKLLRVRRNRPNV